MSGISATGKTPESLFPRWEDVRSRQFEIWKMKKLTMPAPCSRPSSLQNVRKKPPWFISHLGYGSLSQQPRLTQRATGGRSSLRRDDI